MKKKIFLALIIVLVCVCSVNGQGPPPPPPPPPGLPVDGGVLFLFVSGLVYGIRKVKK